MAIDPRQLGKTIATASAAPAVTTAQQKAAAEERVVLEEERIYRRGTVSVRDLIAPAAFQVTPDFVKLGGTYVRSLFIVNYPRYINVGWFAPVINMNRVLDVSMYFYPVKTAIILKQLKKKVGALEAQLLSDQEKGAPRDPIRETALRDIEGLRDSLSQGTEKFFQYALYITVYATSKEELDKISDDVEQLFGNKLVLSKRVYYQAEQGFNSTMPLNNDELMIPFNMNSSPCASSFPFISSELTSNDGILYGINRHNNSLILFDRFSLQNANMVVFATSGAGKSVTGDTEVLVRDAGGSVRLRPIRDVVEGIGTRRQFEQIDDDLEGVRNPGIEVYAFDRRLRGRWSPVRVAARKSAPEDLYAFRTQSGRRIRTTGDHNMLVLRNGQVHAAKSADVRLEECVPLPGVIPEPVQPTTTLDLLTILAGAPKVHVDRTESVLRLRSRLRTPRASLPAQLPVTPALARLLGYIVSEGHIADRYVLISNGDRDVLRDAKRCLDDINIRWFQRRDETIVVSARVFIALVGALGAGGLAGAKRVPPFLLNCSNAIVAEFLRAYFEGDGGVERHSVTACSKSQGLISDLAYLLTRFGISARLAERVKRATNSGAQGIYGVLTISGQEDLQRFSETVGFVTSRKRRALNAVLGKPTNTNVDTVPVADLLRELSEMAEPIVRGNQLVTDIRNGAFRPSRAMLGRLVSELDAACDRFVCLRDEIAPLAELPAVEAIIAAGDAQATNAQLWQTLGHSWQTMRSGTAAPRAQNALRAVAVIGGPRYSAVDVKRRLAVGFHALDIEAKAIAPWLSYALHGRRDTDTDYATLHRAAQFVWKRYGELATRMPEIRECIARLRTLATIPMRWDPITTIERIPNTRDRYVYDLTVDDEVFLAGHGGLFVHNSYAVKLQVARSLMFGVDVIVIDPEMEYKHLSDAVGGTYINVSLASEAKINPFDLPRPASGEEFSAEDIIRSAVITAKGLLKLMIGPFTTDEDAIIDRALLESYAKKDITPSTDLSKLTVKEMPILQDLQQILSGMVGGGPLGERLKKYTEGTFAGLLNSPTNVEMSNQLVIFSVRDLEDELKPIAIYTIVNYIWNVVRSERKKRILVVDEAWWLMQREDSAKFIFALVKRCRKYFLGVTTITQDVNDFLTSPYGKAIVTNSAMQLLLKQSPAAIDLIQQTFLLTQGEKFLLLESGPGEGIFFAGAKHVAIKVVASYTEDQLITSNPQQLLEIERAKQEFEKALAEQAPTDGHGS